MKKTAISILVFGFFAIMGSLINAVRGSAATGSLINEEYIKTMKRDLLCLMMAYPENISNIEGQADGNVYLVLKSGRKVLYDDKKKKTSEEKLANPDLQDMLEQIYPLTTTKKLMEKNFDPGRARVYDLLTEVYGANQGRISQSLVNVKLGYHNYQFNKNNKAADCLKSVNSELMPLIQGKGSIGAYVFPASGTFNFRKIAGTNRLSPHSFGIAIDLARDKHDYWKWATPEEGEKRLSSYPTELVELFERNNFVWGGKWWHFDILHFEYRPEIIMKARYFGKQPGEQNPWYEGAPLEEVSVKEYIEKVNNGLK